MFQRAQLHEKVRRTGSSNLFARCYLLLTFIEFSHLLLNSSPRHLGAAGLKKNESIKFFTLPSSGSVASRLFFFFLSSHQDSRLEAHRLASLVRVLYCAGDGWITRHHVSLSVTLRAPDPFAL